MLVLNVIQYLVFGLYTVLIVTQEAESAKILFYFGSSPYSHKVAVWPLVLKLAEKGHQVTFLSPPFPTSISTPVHVFHPKSLAVFWREKDLLLLASASNNTRFPDPITSRVKGFSDGQGYWDTSMQNSLEICRVIFRSLEVQKWVQEQAEFDLVVIDTPYNECALVLAHHMGAPYILFGSSSSWYMWHQEMFGLADESSWLPNYYYHFPSDMSFFQRVRNTLTPLQWFYSTNRVSYITPQLEKLMRKSLNLSDLPSLDELERSSSLFLLNTHFIQEYPKSLPPFIVSVGGMNLLDDDDKQDTQLPKDVIEFLEKYAQNGFIYVSFGIQTEFSKAPPLVIEKFINTFTILEMPVLWKWGNYMDIETAPIEKPKRVFIAKYFPHTAILSHPKIKILITNGGTLAHQEAIFYGLPTVAFPLTPEEDYDAEIIQNSGMGFSMNIASFTQYELAKNIRKLLSDLTYKKNVKKLSELFKDRPQKPVDTALWWTEYVLRHKNLTFSKPLAINQTWYERRLLDIWMFLGLVIFGSLITLVKSLNYFFSNDINKKIMISSNNSKKPSKQKLKTS